MHGKGNHFVQIYIGGLGYGIWAEHKKGLLLFSLHLSIDFYLVNPLTSMSDQHRISPHNISTTSNRLVMRVKKISVRDYHLIQH